ncbi:MAG: ArdC family protein [Isosphaeraceae bacterium]
MASQQQLRQSITEQITAALEAGGVPPWRRPWRVGPNAGSPANVVGRKAYRGINPILLDMAAARHGLTSKWWATFNQWKQLGGRVMLCPAHVPAPAGVGTASSSSPGHQGRDQRLGRGRRGPLLRHAFLHRLQRRSGRGRPPRPPPGRSGGG